MSSYTVETLPLDKVTPLAENPNRHPEEQIAELVRSIETFGQYRPIVIDDDNVILAGNGLYEAAKRLGLDTIHAYRATGLTADQRTKLILADNRLGNLSFEDFDVVDELLRSLNEADLEIPGYDTDAIRDILADTDEVMENAMSYGVLPTEQIERAQAREEARGDVDDRVTVGEQPAPPAPDPAPAATSEDSAACPTCGKPW